MVAAIGATTQAITVVTVYATLGLDSVIEAVKENQIPVIVCNQKDVKALADHCKEMPSLKVIVYTTDLVAPADQHKNIPPAPKNIKIVSFDDFVEAGDTKAFPVVEPSPDTCAVVMYTSGSTAKPKGSSSAACFL
jgi:long-chain acyl-CoA synthetase